MKKIIIHSIDTNFEQRKHEMQVIRRPRRKYPTPKLFWMRWGAKPGFFFSTLALGGVSLSIACIDPAEISSTQTEQETNPASHKEDMADTENNTTESAGTSVESDESSSSNSDSSESATSLDTDTSSDTTSNTTSDTTDSDTNDNASTDDDPTEMEIPVVIIDAKIYGDDLPQIWAVESTPIALSHCSATALEGNYISIAEDAVEAQQAQTIVYADYFHPITSFSSGGDEQLSVVFLSDERSPYIDADRWHHDTTNDKSLIIPRAFYSEQPFYQVQLYPSPHIVPIDPLATLDDSTQTVSIEYRILDIDGVVYSVREAHTLKHESMFARQGDFTVWDCQ